MKRSEWLLLTGFTLAVSSILCAVIGLYLGLVRHEFEPAFYGLWGYAVLKLAFDYTRQIALSQPPDSINEKEQ